MIRWYLAKMGLLAFLLWGVSVTPLLARSLCVPGRPSPVPPGLSLVYPTPTAVCPYGYDELIRRMIHLVTDPQAVYSVETMEKTFGTPKMWTTYDDPRRSAYLIVLTGAGGWRLEVSVDEGFYPSNKGPADFVPGRYPKRLHSIHAASLDANFNLGGMDTSTGKERCFSVPVLIQALRDAGWHPDDSIHGSDGPDPVVFRISDKMVVMDDVRPCVNNLSLREEPTQRLPRSQ
jgi:hypothetical protein